MAIKLIPFDYSQPQPAEVREKLDSNLPNNHGLLGRISNYFETALHHITDSHESASDRPLWPKK